MHNLLRFETSSGLPLFGMSVADSICLFAQLTQAVFHFAVKIVLQADLYLMHSTSAFSVWSWLLLSLLRYMAVFHPLKYRYQRNSLKLQNVFEEDQLFHAYKEDDKFQATHIMDITFSYVVPACLRIILDGKVLIHCHNPFRHSCELLLERRQTFSMFFVGILVKRDPHCKKKNAIIIRSLVISGFNLMCNLPSHVLRALLNFFSSLNLQYLHGFMIKCERTRIVSSHSRCPKHPKAS
uniref:Uncharacterized protein n=1 Tax=Parascaris equorum TaxID=6256 RepID=A0A914RTI6_PAREQ